MQYSRPIYNLSLPYCQLFVLHLFNDLHYWHVCCPFYVFWFHVIYIFSSHCFYLDWSLFFKLLLYSYFILFIYYTVSSFWKLTHWHYSVTLTTDIKFVFRSRTRNMPFNLILFSVFCCYKRTSCKLILFPFYLWN